MEKLMGFWKPLTGLLSMAIFDSFTASGSFYIILSRMRFYSKICSHIETYIRDLGWPLFYLNSSKTDKGDFARQCLDQSPDKTGLICTFSAVELCKTMTVKPKRSTNELEVTSCNTKCKHYYFYYNDKKFGWMFLKIQTWFPYNVQIYLNGREYFSRLREVAGVPYSMYNNSFSYLEDFPKAQQLADQVLNKKLSDPFDGMMKKINCLLLGIEEVFQVIGIIQTFGLFKGF